MQTAWMNLEEFTPSEISQSQKGKHCSMPFTRVSKIIKPMEAKNRVTVFAQGGRGRGKWGVADQWI